MENAIDPVRISKRDDLVVLIDELGLKTGAELGVREGAFSAHLLSNSKLNTLYSVDAWCSDESKTKSAFKRCDLADNKIEKWYEEAVRKLAPFGSRSKIVRSLSWEAASQFDDGSLDFVYVDASHKFTGVAMDLAAWWPKVRWGGVFAGHDYWHAHRYHVVYAVNGFALEHYQIFNLTTEERDYPRYAPSWWLVKTKRTRDEFTEALKQHRAEALREEKVLSEHGSPVSLPYEYLH